MRKPLVAGNWKMNGTVAESVRLASAVLERLAADAAAEVVICPPFTSLAAVAETVAGGPIRLGASQ